MASVYKRASDKARGKAGKWTCRYMGSDGKWHSFVGVTDKAESLKLAQHRETEARRVTEGLASPHEKTQREASLKTPAAHIADYRDSLISKGGTEPHANQIARTLNHLFREASITSVGDISGERIESVLGKMLASGKSPRTCNYFLVAARSFARWLWLVGRIREIPRSLAAIGAFNQSVGRKRVRRAATMEELLAIFAASEAGDSMHVFDGPPCVANRVLISGPSRAALYRLALGTGFRVNELRSLLPEWFHLDGDEPSIKIPAESTKNRREANQPIARQLADMIRPFVAACPPGKPVLIVPARAAHMLRHDLALANIPYETADGYLDFHALRHTYITHMIASGENPKVVQKLARHANIALTLGIYTHVTDPELRKAIERKAS